METPVKILFGAKPDWEPGIRAKSPASWSVSFGDFYNIDFNEYDLIIPINISDYWPLRQAGESVARKCILPNDAAVKICDDKSKFNETAVRGGLGNLIPSVITAATAKDVELPVIIKKKVDQFGANSYLIKTPQDLASHSALLESDEYFCQEYVSGSHEYTTHFLMIDGEPVFQFGIDYDMGDDLYVKSGRKQQRSLASNDGQNFSSTFVDLLRAIGFYNGTCCVNYKIHKSLPKVFEVNPRFGGSLVYDLPNYVIAYARALDFNVARLA